ncbi:hypothetical protein LM596_09915 [Liquorilactobacillus mali]|nr:hypothetical protein LMA_01024 [Liquorilactobacillus mali KCTC 3596 = DSM 20444]QFQ75391.1 hypothetical protein LM596_09915 [Liquorilactobacillus mali]
MKFINFTDGFKELSSEGFCCMCEHVLKIGIILKKLSLYTWYFKLEVSMILKITAGIICILLGIWEFYTVRGVFVRTKKNSGEEYFKFFACRSWECHNILSSANRDWNYTNT